MKKMIKFAVDYPVTIFMVVLGILLLGKISYDKLSVDLLPSLNNPKLFIEIKAGEAPPEEIERQFVESMEAMAVRQRDVTAVSSVIRTGSARITVEYTWKKDMDEAFLDLQKAMNSFTQNRALTELNITQHDPNTSPVVLIGMSHSNIEDMAELRKVANTYVRNELTRLEGVADVTLSGDEVSTLVVETDVYKLNAFNLRIEDISGKIEESNRNISGGRVSELGLQYIVKGKNAMNTEADFERLIVGYKPTDSGEKALSAPIFLSEVARIRFENARPENIVRINGVRSIGLSVYKEMRYNTVKVVDAIIKELATIEKALPGYHFQVVTNQGTFINSSIGEVKDSAVLGVVLAVFVLYLFLRRIGTTLIVSAAIPISIIATFNLMFFNGLTLNIMTLGGLALGAGMLIDNSIVVIESIFRNKESGLSTREASIKGTSEVAGAVTASTLTTIVVFLPIVYLHGVSGELFKDQAWTVTFSLLSSLFVAILVIPMLYNTIFGNKRELKPVKSIQMKGYGRFLRRLLSMRWLVISLALAMVILTSLLIPYIGTEFMPKAEGRSFSVNVKLPEGTRLERTAAAAMNLESVLRNVSADSAITVYSHTGPGSGSSNAIFEGENTAMIKVILSEKAPKLQKQVVEEFLAATAGIEGAEITIGEDEYSMSSLLGGEGSPVVVEVKGEELDEIARITLEVKERMENMPALFNITSSVEDGAPEVSININRMFAGMNSLNVATIVNQIKGQLGGYTAGQMDYRGEMRDIVVKVPETELSSLGSMIIKGTDREFRLSEIAAIEKTTAPKEILRHNQSRISKVMANLAEGTSLDKAALQIKAATANIELPANYSIMVTGEEAKRKESMDSLIFALMLSVILVYMVLASQFESLLHPFTILLTIPLAVVGAILLFWLTSTTLNIMGAIGIVMLVGIAINNAIILVDRINQLKAAGMPLTDAIVEAGQQRIRPILMTSITTILALMPMAFSAGDGASLRSPMAIAVIGGLITSTALSLIVIPCVYDVLERMKMRLNKKENLPQE